MRHGLRVAYVLRSWPRLSQTFILNEILELERIGVDISIFALARSSEPLVQPQLADVKAPVRYLDGAAGRRTGAHLRVALRSPRRYLGTLAHALRRGQLFGGYTRIRPGRAFDAAVLMADQLGRQGAQRPRTHIHAHFAHDPALVGLLAHRISDLPFSFTAHARDLYQIPGVALRERTREASATITCCQTNVDYIHRVVGPSTPVDLIYHGVDLTRFRAASSRSGNGVPLVLSVGRLVDKKGFDDLLKACAVVARTGRAFRCEIYGEGPNRGPLESLRDALGLKGIVEFSGARTQAELLPLYQQADIFALTPRVTEDGDRDGVPNVFLEAMACATPILTTRVGGIDEVVRDGSNGVLIEIRDTQAIASGLVQLLDDPDMRKRLGSQAVETAGNFDVRRAADRLAVIFEHADGGAR